MKSSERVYRHVLSRFLGMRIKHMEFFDGLQNLFIFYIDYITTAKSVNCFKAEKKESIFSVA